VEDLSFNPVFGSSSSVRPFVNSFAAGEDGSIYAAGAFMSADREAIFNLARFVAAPRLADARVEGSGGISFTITNPRERSIQVDVSNNLRDWVPAGPVTTNQNSVYLDPTLSVEGTRFFRARVR
jgi:hypothetical protein